MSDASKTETQLTQGISNETICRYFYIMFMVVVVLSVFVVGVDVYVMMKRPAAGFSMLLRSAPTLVIALVNTLFMYTLCARTLLK
jgi:hypothetical protein